MPTKPGDVWLSVDCHSCGRLILVAEVPPAEDRGAWLAIFDEAQPVKCPFCQGQSEYQPGEIVALLAEQTH